MSQKIAKKIRRIARQLPNSVIEQEVKTKLRKSQLSAEEFEKVKNWPGDYVMHKKIEPVKIDHEKLLKAYHKEYGTEKFVEAYLAWFTPHHMKMQAKYSDMLEPLPEDQKTAA